MRIPRIYYLGKLNPDEQVELTPDSSHYILNVLRLKLDSPLTVFNGDGNEYYCHIVNIQKKRVSLTIDDIKVINKESPLKIHLLQGISRGERMDFALQKAVELGVSRITPLITDYCQVKMDQIKSEKKNAHWQSIITSACEQSGRTILPILDSYTRYQSAVEGNQNSVKIICHPGVSAVGIREFPHPEEVCLLIGPEGGFSDQEVALAQQNHFIRFSLGPRILRTETAALTAISILQSLWGDIG